jgi:transcriptional regulator with XRE-family HTH domain
VAITPIPIRRAVAMAGVRRRAAQTTIAARALGRELERMRTAAGLTIGQAGQLVYKSDSTISRLEQGKAKIDPLTIEALARGYGASPEDIGRLVAMAGEVIRSGDPLTGYTVPPGMETLLGLEPEASVLRVYSLALVFGPFQTNGYAQAVIAAGSPGLPEDQVNSRVRLREKRAAVLLADGGPRIHAVIDEAALRRPVGGPEALRSQLEHLRVLADRPALTLQMLPFSAGAHPGQTGSFLHLAFPDDTEPDLVYCDGAAGNAYLQKSTQVSAKAALFDQLSKAAYDPDATKTWLDTAIKEIAR